MYCRQAALSTAEFITICLFPLDPVAASAQGERPTAKASRIDSSQAPTIDGDLSDPAWANATVIGDFRQREPIPGAAPTERTVLRIMFDENNLYFGVYAYDSA